MSDIEKKWEPLLDGVWVARYRIPGLPCRSCAIRLEDGSFAVMSPGGDLVESFERELGGDVAFLWAPNSYHWLGIEPWQKRHTDASVCASPGAHARLGKKGGLSPADLGALRDALPAGVDVFDVPGTRIGESMAVAKAGEDVAWLVCDSFFNLPRLSSKLVMRTMSRVMKSGPGLCISGLMKWGGVNDRRAYKTFMLEHVESDQPTILAPAHGDVAQGADLAHRLDALIRERL